ncbi:hypothetical protein CDV36_000636 [Fusarium kuroshium]|uniref:Ecp2 effector protein domain-containing protein n=2 Tax=Fusarium solani species complex TaxID=232080 RepID=A0A3M2SQ19_9HYPO|nr:hypothetical protein CDV36_000636 [Fusarium kuroshium]RSL74930.1 hypothetical protein CEP51_011335 [Fusarium floridanum]
MLFLSILLSFLSFTSANILSKGKPLGDPVYDSSKYHWECGKTTVAMLDDCEHIFTQIRNLGNTTDGTFKLNWWPARVWDHKSCRALLDVGELPGDGLKLHADEFVKVARWGAQALCGGTWQRSMVRPQNDTWRLYIVESMWNQSVPFA